MNIKQAKEEIKHTVTAYLKKDDEGRYKIPLIRQRPVLLMGPPGIGKTQIMEQIAEECKIGLVAYTITHHTRQSAVGLPMIKEESFDGTTYPVTEYTMSEIIASIYRKMKKTGQKEGILFIDEINCVSETLAPTMLQFLQCTNRASSPLDAVWARPMPSICISASRTSSVAVWPSAASTLPTTASAIIWTSWFI